MRRIEVLAERFDQNHDCPQPGSCAAVGNALDRLGVIHLGRFTTAVVFRRWPKRGGQNLVKNGRFVCRICGAELPGEWNF